MGRDNRPSLIRDLKVAVRLIVMQVALGEGANKKCRLLYCLGGHCVLTLSPGARIWLSLALSPVSSLPFNFLLSADSHSASMG